MKRGRNVKYAPYAFTEHGAVMLASVLKSPAAIEASLQVVRAFVRLRGLLAGHKELAQKLEALEQQYDHQFKVVFEAIRQLRGATARSEIVPTRTGDDARLLASAPQSGFWTVRGQSARISRSLSSTA